MTSYLVQYCHMGRARVKAGVVFLFLIFIYRFLKRLMFPMRSPTVTVVRVPGTRVTVVRVPGTRAIQVVGGE